MSHASHRGFLKIMLVEKLRETRAFAGFTRIFPDNEQSLAERKGLLWRAVPETDEWLPAYVVFGEGIFLALDEERVRRWETQANIVERSNGLEELSTDFASVGACVRAPSPHVFSCRTH